MRLVVDPHAERVVGVEDEAGNSLGQATALDAIANIRRVRRKPEPVPAPGERTGPNLVEIAHAQLHVFDDRYFMASNELNLLNTLLLAKQDDDDGAVID